MAGCVVAAIIHATITFALPAGSLQALTAIMTISAVFAPLYLGAVIALHCGLAPIHQLAGVAREMMPSGWRRDYRNLGAEVAGASGTEDIPMAASKGRV